MSRTTLLLIAIFFSGLTTRAFTQTLYHEMYRPQIHFSPKANWMNDPNGMVYSNGVYHLFFQYHPYSAVWGPMHWGHATSDDLIHWHEQTIALYPDSIGTIFSGSAVVDRNNTSGFGKDGKIPLVAIFTQHDTVGEKAHRNDFQKQSIAYSLDYGKTWAKYPGNPVLTNPGIPDFRDPKVMWYEPQKKWIMTLATKDRVTFYSSPDLKTWRKESEFGKEFGSHGGVWECPDLISFDDNGKKTWVLIVSVNPGGPNGGSATQYFTGDFDGNKFTCSDTATKWVDYGPDDYAGVTWSNTGSRHLFLGWMSNWDYGQLVPTNVWRSAMTIPRELRVKHVNNKIFLASEPASELDKISSTHVEYKDVMVNGSFVLPRKNESPKLPCRLDLALDKPADFSVILSNDAEEKLLVGFDKTRNQYFVDRKSSGKVDFQKGFAGHHTAPRLTSDEKLNVTLVIDVSSIELFADDGLSVMTEIFFPSTPYDKISIQSPGNILFKKITYTELRSIWP